MSILMEHRSPSRVLLKNQIHSPLGGQATSTTLLGDASVLSPIVANASNGSSFKFSLADPLYSASPGAKRAAAMLKDRMTKDGAAVRPPYSPVQDFCRKTRTLSCFNSLLDVDFLSVQSSRICCLIQPLLGYLFNHSRETRVRLISHRVYNTTWDSNSN